MTVAVLRHGLCSLDERHDRGRLAVLSTSQNFLTFCLARLQEEQGGAGVYSADLRARYGLKDPAWRYDIMPEIAEGRNVADFVDPDIAARLVALDAEEDALAAAAQVEVRALFPLIAMTFSRGSASGRHSQSSHSCSCAGRSPCCRKVHLDGVVEARSVHLPWQRASSLAKCMAKRLQDTPLS